MTQLLLWEGTDNRRHHFPKNVAGRERILWGHPLVREAKFMLEDF